MVSSIVVLSTKMQKTKMRSSKHIIKINAQKKMGTYSFGHKYHDLNFLEPYFLFHIPRFIIFEAIIKRRRNINNKSSTTCNFIIFKTRI